MARMTIKQIWESAIRLSPWRRNYTTSPKRQITQIVPFLGTKTILFTAQFWGLTSKSIHLSNILFLDCEIIEELAPQQQAVNTVPQLNQPSTQTPTVKPYGGVVNAQPNYSSATHFKVTYQGKNYWIKKIDMSRQSALVRCSCEDYYFVWSYFNYVSGIQYGGRARPYVRKTRDRKPRNPAKVPGGCKHVIGQLPQMLQASGYAL